MTTSSQTSNDNADTVPIITWDDFLTSQIVCAFGASERENFKNTPLTGNDLAAAIMRNIESPTKGGTCFAPVQLIDDTPVPGGKNLTARNVSAVTMIVFDCDCGQSIEDATAKLKAEGIGHFGSTSFNNGVITKSVVDAAFIKFVRSRGNANEPTIDDARVYLAEKAGYVPAVATSVTAAPIKHVGKDGAVTWIIQHAPLAKFRGVVPITTRLSVLDEAGQPSKDKRDQFAEFLKLFFETYGIQADPVCSDVGRLYFAPRHPKGTTPQSFCFPGAPFDWRPLMTSIGNTKAEPRRATPKTAVKRSATGADGVFQHAKARTGARIVVDRPSVGPINLKLAVASGLKWCNLADAVKAVVPPDDLGSMYDGKIDMACPYQHDHLSATNPAGFMVTNPGILTEVAGFHAKCSHGGCAPKGNDRLIFLAGLLETYPALWDELGNEARYSVPPGVTMDFAALSRVLQGLPPTELPTGYVIRDGMIQVVGHGDSDEEEAVYTPVCGPFRLIGETHDELDEGWTKFVEFETRTGVIKRVAVDWSAISSDPKAIATKLSHAGLKVFPNPKAKNALQMLLTRWESSKLIKHLSRPGFHEDVFVTPLGEIINGDPETTVLHPDKGALNTTKAGTLESWQSHLAEPIVRLDVPHWLLGLYSGVAGTVLQLIGEPTCGLNFSGTTSRGKSTAQFIGAGVWGDPTAGHAILIAARTTTNGMEYQFPKATGASIHIDEMKLMSTKEIGPLIFLFAGEQGKVRMTQNLAQRPTLKWRTFVTMSCEQGVRKLIEESGAEMLGGQSARVMDLNVDTVPSIDPLEAKRIKEATFKHYGHAGPALVRHLYGAGHVADGGSRIRKRIDDHVSSLVSDNRQPAVARTARIPALLWICAELMQSAGLIADTPDNTRQAESAIRWSWAQFMASPEAQALRPDIEDADRVIQWLHSNRGGVVSETTLVAGTRAVEAWYDDKKVYLLMGALQRHKVIKGSEKACFAELKQRKILIPMNQTSNVHRNIPNVGKDLKHYRLNLELLSQHGAIEAICQDVRSAMAGAVVRPKPDDIVH